MRKVIRMREVLPSLAQQFLARVTGDLAVTVIYERDVAGQIRLHYTDNDLINDGAEALLAFAQVLFLACRGELSRACRRSLCGRCRRAGGLARTGVATGQFIF